MAKKKQNISITGPLSWQTIKTYLGGELSEKEMYNLERKIQNEPFEQEAFNGFYDHAPASMENDLDELRIKIERKTGNTLKVKKVTVLNINWKLVAAIIFIVILIPILLYFLLRSDEGKVELIENTSKTKTGQMTQASKMEEDSVEVNDHSDSENLRLEDERQDKESRQSAQAGIIEQTNRKTSTQTASAPESIVGEKLEKQALTKEQLTDLDTETAASSETDIPLSPSLETSNEKAIKTDSSRTEKVDTSRDRLSRTPARPPGGMEGYKAYIKSQLLDSYRNAQGTFIIRVVVANNGELTSVDIREGGNRRTNKKLQSIVEKAPSWSPANEEGKASEDTVTFSLILK